MAAASGGRWNGSARPACRPCSPSSPRAASPGARRKCGTSALGKEPSPEGSTMRLFVLLSLLLLLGVPVAAQRTPFPDGTVEIAYGADARQRLEFTPAA